MVENDQRRIDLEKIVKIKKDSLIVLKRSMIKMKRLKISKS